MNEKMKLTSAYQQLQHASIKKEIKSADVSMVFSGIFKMNVKVLLIINNYNYMIAVTCRNDIFRINLI